MKVECERCKKMVELVDFTTSAAGMDVRCSACGERFFIASPGTRASDAPPAVVARAVTNDAPAEKTVPASGPACPKCGAPRVDRGLAETEDNCARCGLVFVRWKGRTGGDAEDASELLVKLWRAVEEAYQDAARHDAFLAACAISEGFVYAAERYRRILLDRPNDEIAQARQAEVRALVTQWALSQPGAHRQVRVSGKAWLYVIVVGLLILALGFVAAMMMRLNRLNHASGSANPDPRSRVSAFDP